MIQHQPRSFTLTLIGGMEYLFISSTGVCLIFFNVIGEDTKLYVLISTFLVSFIPVTIRVLSKEWTWKELGFRTDTIRRAMPLYGFSTIGGILVLYVYSRVYHTHNTTVSFETLLLYSVCGSIAQEFLYRAYLMKLGEFLFGDTLFNSVINIVVFVGMHSFYDGFTQKLWVLIPAGILFTFLYRKCPNFLCVCAAHIILNAFAVAVGIFH